MAKKRMNAYDSNYPAYKEHIDKLIKAFPAVFDKDRPLMLPIGVHESLINYVNISEKDLKSVLFIWTRRCEYKTMMACGGVRYNLDGSICSHISEWEIANAIDWVCRFRKEATIAQAQSILEGNLKQAAVGLWVKKARSNRIPYVLKLLYYRET